MNGFITDPAAMTTIAATLRRGAWAVDDVPAPPPPPRAGACTAVVNTGIAALCENAATIVGAYLAAGDTTDATLREYQAADQPELFEGRP